MIVAFHLAFYSLKMAYEYLSTNLMTNQLVPVQQFLPLPTASEPVTLAEPSTVSSQQEPPPSVSAPSSASPASTPLEPQLPPIRSPQLSEPPLLRTQSDGRSQLSHPPPSSQFPLSVLRPIQTKSGPAKVMLVVYKKTILPPAA